MNEIQEKQNFHKQNVYTYYMEIQKFWYIWFSYLLHFEKWL